MKKFEINFCNTWGAGHFDLFTTDFYTAKTATWLEITICNFELDVTFRSEKQLKEQKKWDREMEKRVKEWTTDDFNISNITPTKKAKKTVKKVAAKKRKTTK